MKRRRGRFLWQRHLLGLLIVIDSVLFGTALGVVCPPAFAPVGQEADARPENRKQVALTFDDGPHSVCTPRLLDGLKEKGVKATFFLMGQNIDGNEAIVERMQREGHLIGSHGYRHVKMTEEGKEEVCRSLERTEEKIFSITGQRPAYLRPPYGDWNEELECQVDRITVFWSVDSMDWKLQNADKIVARVKKDVKDGAIILIHDIFPSSVEAALRLVDELEALGYEFVTVDELLI